MTNDLVPPQALEAEESLLGCMMLSERAVDAAADILDGTEFYRDSHATIYRAALALHNEGVRPDVITLADRLEQTGELDSVGGRVNLHQIAALVPATTQAGRYAKIIADCATLRDLGRAGDEIKTLASERGDDVLLLVDRAEQIMYGVGNKRGATIDLSPQVPAVVANIHRLHDNPQELIGTPSGYPVIDQLTQGFQPGNLIILAARPSMGKSALGINMAVRLVGKDIPVAIFTLEMSKAEIVQRALAIGANVSGEKIKNPRKMSQEELQRVDDFAARLDQAPLYVREAGTLTPTEIRAQTRRLKAKVPGLALVMVDYLQLMTTGGRHSGDNRVQEVSEISRMLKTTARDLDVPIIAMSQLSRAVEQRTDKRPILSDLRESGSIEQDADLVAFLYRGSYYEAPDQRGPSDWTEVILAKHRNGPTDTVRLVWIPDKAQFSNPAPVRLAGDIGEVAA